MIARGIGEEEITKRASYFSRAGTAGDDTFSTTTTSIPIHKRSSIIIIKYASYMAMK
jgi:hypothetical protein